MKRLKRELNLDILRIIYNALIAPLINYAVISWGRASKTRIRRIEILQKKAVRAVTNSRYNSHTGPLFHKLKILPLKDTYQLNCCRLYHKALNSELPMYHTSKLRANLSIHAHHIRNRGNIHIYPVSKEYQKDSINFKIGTCWNNLPDEVKSVSFHSQYSFKRKLKTYLLEKHNRPCNINNCYINVNIDYYNLRKPQIPSSMLCLTLIIIIIIITIIITNILFYHFKQLTPMYPGQSITITCYLFS